MKPRRGQTPGQQRRKPTSTVDHLIANDFATGAPQHSWQELSLAKAKGRPSVSASPKQKIIAVLKRLFPNGRPMLVNREIFDRVKEDPEVKRWPASNKPSDRTVDRAIHDLWGSSA
jgi:hypothetical protein